MDDRWSALLDAADAEPAARLALGLPAPLEGLEKHLIDVATRCGRLAESAGRLVATAESCTGGAIARALTETAGSSAWFDSGFITYSNRAKCAMLGVDEGLIGDHGAVSEAVVRAMVEGAIARSQAGHGVAVTGIAGPGGGSPGKPVGTVWFGWAMREPDGRIAVLSRKQQFDGDRTAVRLRTALYGLSVLGTLIAPAIERQGAANG